jgi:hypothetical protein
MIILDTNVISELMRPQPDPGVLAWVATQPRAQLYTTHINQAEIRYRGSTGGTTAHQPGVSRKGDVCRGICRTNSAVRTDRNSAISGDRAVSAPCRYAHRGVRRADRSHSPGGRRECRRTGHRWIFRLRPHVDRSLDGRVNTPLQTRFAP